ALLRTRNVHGCLTPGLWVPLRAPKGGWACKRRAVCWLPRVLVSVRQKCRQFTNTAEVLCRRGAAARKECTTARGRTQEPAGPSPPPTCSPTTPRDRATGTTPR